MSHLYRALPVPGWLLAVAAAWMVVAGLSMARACTLAGDGVHADTARPCATQSVHVGCCGAGGCSMAPTARQPAIALSQAPGPGAPVAINAPRGFLQVRPALPVLAAPASVVPLAGAPPAREGVVLLI